MSTYESEKGSWSFPSKEWTKVRQNLMDAEFTLKQQWYDVLLKLWHISKTVTAKEFKENKGKFLTQAEIEYFGRTWVRAWGGGGEYKPNTPTGWGDHYWTVMDMIKLGVNGKMKKPKKPTKRKKEDRMNFDCGDGYITCNFTSRTLEWEVQENNHAVDRAWKSPIAIALGKILNKTNFTGNTGGYTIYRCEYDESYEPSYTNVYGKQVKKQLGWS
jgi:hypothetical protein